MDQTRVSRTGGRRFNLWATREAPGSWEAPLKGKKMTEIVAELIYNTYIQKYVNKDDLEEGDN